MSTNHFFIVGTGRCGSQMLYRMLRTHPEMNIVVESHFLPALMERFGTGDADPEEFYEMLQAHSSSRGKAWINIISDNERIDTSEIKSRYVKFCEQSDSAGIAGRMHAFHQALFGEQLAYLGDKTPHYGVTAGMVRQVWPKAKMIHLIRDGVYTALSMMKHPGFVKMINSGVPVDQLDYIHYQGKIAEFSSDEVTLESAMNFWRDVIVKTREELNLLPQEDVLEIRYEDLITNPEVVLREMMNFLGCNIPSSWIRQAALGPRAFAYKTMINRITEEYYAEAYVQIEETMRSFGYEGQRDFVGMNLGSDMRELNRWVRRRLSGLKN